MFSIDYTTESLNKPVDGTISVTSFTANAVHAVIEFGAQKNTRVSVTNYVSAAPLGSCAAIDGKNYYYGISLHDYGFDFYWDAEMDFDASAPINALARTGLDVSQCTALADGIRELIELAQAPRTIADGSLFYCGPAQYIEVSRQNCPADTGR